MISPSKSNYNKFLAIFTKMQGRGRENLKKMGEFFHVAIHFHPCHPQPRTNDTSFCALVGPLLTKLTLFDVYIHAGMFFGYSK